ncbi:23S rRNA-/tRNA-specific pseudouridylate synthase [Sphingomonas sp. PvP055]
MDRGVSTIEARIADEAGLRLDRALADALPTISRERLKALISTGQVTDEAGTLRRDPASKAMPGGLYRILVPDPTPAQQRSAGYRADGSV